MAAVPNRLYAARSPEAVELWIPESEMPGGGGGDVIGPSSAGDGNLAVYDETTGKLIKDGGTVAEAIAAAQGFMLLLARRELDENEFLALGDTPIEIVATPGEGKIILPIQAAGMFQLNGRNGVNLPANVQLLFDTNDFANLIGGETITDDIAVSSPVDLVGPLANYAELPVTVASAENPVLLGSIAISNISNGGADWEVNDIFHLGGTEEEGGAVGVVDTVLDGAVVTYHFTNEGTLLHTGDDQEATPDGEGIGNGLLIDIDVIDAGEGILTYVVELLYRVMDLA